MPFKYAQKEVKGIVYILSFGIGVAIVRLFPMSSPNTSHTIRLAMHQLLCNPASDIVITFPYLGAAM